MTIAKIVIGTLCLGGLGGVAYLAHRLGLADYDPNRPAPMSPRTHDGFRDRF